MNQWEARQQVLKNMETPQERRKRSEADRRFYSRLGVTILALFSSLVTVVAIPNSPILLEIIGCISAITIAYIFIS